MSVLSDSCAPSWLSSISSQLETRDAREKHPFEKVSECYSALLTENLQLNAQVSDLKQALLRMKQDQWKASSRMSDSTLVSGASDENADSSNSGVSSPSVLGAFTSGVSGKAQSEMIEKLKAELMDVLRKRNEEAEALRRVKKECEESEQLVIEKGRLLDEVTRQMEKLNEEIQELKFDNNKLRSSMTVMNAENSALRTAHDSATDELDRAAAENRRLTQKILDVKKEQMEMQNEMQKEFAKFQDYRISHSIVDAAASSLVSVDSEDGHTSSATASYAHPSLSYGSKDSGAMSMKHSAQSGRVRSATMSASPTSSSADASGSSTFKKTLSSMFGGIFDGTSSASGADSGASRRRSATLSLTSDFLDASEGPSTHVAGDSFLSVTPPQLESHSWLAHGDAVGCIAFDPSGKQLLSVSGDKTVKLWHASTGSEICRFSGVRASALLCCSFNRSGAYIVAGGNSSSVYLWSVRTQKQLRVYNGHANAVTCAGFSQNTKTVVSGSLDRTIRVWDTERGGCRKTINAKSSVNNLDWNRQQRSMIGTAHLDGCIRFWSLKGPNREAVYTITDHKPSKTNGIMFEPRDSFHCLTSSMDGRIMIYDVRTFKRLLEINDSTLFKNSHLGGNPVYSPDGRYILGGSCVAKYEKQYPICVWDSSDAKLKVSLAEHRSSLTCVAWNSTGGAASGDSKGNIKVWV